MTRSLDVEHAALLAGVEHLFGATGVDRFRILGIEVGAGLDPNELVHAAQRDQGRRRLMPATRSRIGWTIVKIPPTGTA